LREQTVGAAQGVWIPGDALRTAVLSLGHKVRPLEYGDVLLHGGKRHVVASGELGHRRLRGHDSCQDVTPGRIGESAEEVIESRARLWSLCNHLVVNDNTARPGRSASCG
jgi:hypothetical protein